MMNNVIVTVKNVFRPPVEMEGTWVVFFFATSENGTDYNTAKAFDTFEEANNVKPGVEVEL